MSCAGLSFSLPLALLAATFAAVPAAAAAVPPAAPVNDAASRFVDGPAALSALAVQYARRGDAAVRGSDFAGAARAYALAAQSSPKEPTLRLALGITLSAARRTDLAIPQFRTAVQLADDDVVAQLLLQAALSEKGEAAEAQEVGQDVSRRFSRKGKPGLEASGSVRRLTATLARLPDSPTLRLLLGDAYQLSEEWAKADEAYREARRRAPLWSKPLVNGGLSLLAQGKTDEAIRAFADALRLDPANAQAQLWKGEAELRAGKNDRAISTLKQVATSPAVANNLRVQANTSLGQAFANARSFSKAEDALSTARKLAPDDPTAAAVLGEVKLQNGDYHGAARAYDTALGLTRSGGLFSPRPILYRALAEAQLSAHQHEAALETLRRAQSEEPGSAPLWHRLAAQALFDMGQEEQALTELCTALDLEPGRYPLDTLNALAARGLMVRVRDRYQRDLDIARTGFSVTNHAGAMGGGGIAIANVPSGFVAGSRDLTARQGSGVPLPSGAIAPPAPAPIVVPNSLNGHALTPAAAAPASQRHRNLEAAAGSDPQVRALAALASLARYSARTPDEIALRKALAERRGAAIDWYLLAEAYDLRASEPGNARTAYLKALETTKQSSGTGGGSLTTSQIAWGRKRLETLTAPLFKP
jgi:tetratricopeptide (TPR) repeat protein